MVLCDRGGSTVGPGGSGSGFRLSGRESVSSASLYKQRIDSMFDEERSVISQTYGTAPAPSIGSRSLNPKASSISGRLDGPGGLVQAVESSRPRSNSIGQVSVNSVQASIERMFSELALETDNNTPGTHSFSVDYLGSTPLPRRVTSLSGLQAPLARLYLAYRKTKPVVSASHTPELAARLDITRAGLHVRHCSAKGDLEQLNPFPTIAVWSAVKFVVQPSEEDKNVIQFAFLPLITDPDNIDKQALFKNLEPTEKKYILGRDVNTHSPLFTVVMRKIGVAKQLECHGFVCQTSEDAIVIAATLYKSLMAHMSRVPRARNGITGPSVASSGAPVRPPRRKRTPSSLSGDSDTRNSVRADNLSKVKSLKSRRAVDAAVPHPPPPPPPNKLSGIDQVKAKLATIKNTNEKSGSSKDNSGTNAIYNESMEFLSNQHNKQPNSSKDSSVRSKVSEKIELFSGLEKNKDIPRPSTLPPPVPVKPKRDEAIVPVDLNVKPTVEPLRRSHSLRNSCEPGDILTKVAIPRSGSFLNASGLSRYKSTGQRNNGKKGGGSPLGFNELFNEFRVQEDLHSMDDILGAIIDAEGMSFNDLKPIYKEFLLKLAVTLTKDELFQHSKAIMRRQKKKLLRRNSTVQNKRKKMLIGARGLKMVFRKPFGKDILKSKLLNIGDKKPINPFDISKLSTNKKKLIITSESSVSTSSYDLRQFHPKETSAPTPKRQSVRRRNSKRSEKAVGHGAKISNRQGKGRAVERVSTSEDSDFLTLSRRMGCQNRNSSSGYVSCSECESESCADRCYCAARARPRQAPSPPSPPVALEACCDRNDKCCDCTEGESSRCYSCCGCDTESCADSDKCYCRTEELRHTSAAELHNTSNMINCHAPQTAKARHHTSNNRHVSKHRHTSGNKNNRNIIQTKNDRNVTHTKNDRNIIQNKNDQNILNTKNERHGSFNLCQDTADHIIRARHESLKERHKNRGMNDHRGSMISVHHDSIGDRHSGIVKCAPRRSPRRRSAPGPGPGPATLDSLYYEPLRPKARSVIDNTVNGLDFLTRRSSRFDTFERMSCSTEIGRTSSALSLSRGGRKSYSSDNLALDYDLFMSNRGLAGHYISRKGSSRIPAFNYSSKEALLSHKSAEVANLFSDGRLLSAHRGLYRGPSAALADSLGYLP